MLAYLAEHVTMTLATSREGQPRATTLFYANDGFDLYFVSAVSSLHSIDLLANPSVAVTVSQDYADWRDIRGIQIRGKAELGAHDLKAREVYLGKFPAAATFPEDSFRYWFVHSEWIRMIDNTLGFAHKDDLTL